MSRFVAAQVVLHEADGSTLTVDIAPTDDHGDIEGALDMENEARYLSDEETDFAAWRQAVPTGRKFVTVSLKGRMVKVSKRPALGNQS